MAGRMPSETSQQYFRPAPIISLYLPEPYSYVIKGKEAYLKKLTANLNVRSVEVGQEIGRRLGRIFLRDENGRRAVYGGTEKFQNDPHWRDLILFYEYFHGDNGAGIGASHQTGWTGTIANLIQLSGVLTGESVIAGSARFGFQGKH